LFKLKIAFIGLLLVFFLIPTISFPTRTQAQINPVIIAGGFEFNLFADPTVVPEFAASAFSGPTAMAFDSRGRLFVGTYSGKILILLDTDDNGRMDEVKTFASGISIPLGLVFGANGDLYVTSNLLQGEGRILRLRDTNGDDVMDEQTVLIGGLPSAGDHQTNRLRFGPDGLLYFGQGSATDNGTPKGIGFPAEGPLNATIMRFNVNSPNPTPEVFATGLRNPFGMAFHPENGELFSTDGGSGELCQGGTCPEDTSPPEEVNWVVQGGNYGFPQCEGTPDERPGCGGVRAPIQQFARHLTPTSLAFYTGPQAGDLANQLLVTLYKRLGGQGGDLRRLKIEGNKTTGFFVTANEQIADIRPIDPFDGPIDTLIDPISGDIYVVRFDPVNHRDANEHHHFIYRIHRQGSDALPFINSPAPLIANLPVQGGANVPINLVGRHLKTGVEVLANGSSLATGQSGIFNLTATVPVPASATNGSQITIQVRNPDGTLSNSLALKVVRDGIIIDPPPTAPQIQSFFAYFKKRANVQTSIIAGTKAKKLRLVVTGVNFVQGSQLVVNNTPLELESASATELVGLFIKPLVNTPGQLTIQVRNPNNAVSNTVTLNVIP
jgi:glucose/arabinose dehydrogenase